VSAWLTRTGPAKRSPDEAPHGIREWQEVAGFAGTFADHFRGVGRGLLRLTVEVLQGTFHLFFLSLDLSLHVTGRSSESLLHFPANALGAAGKPIVSHEHNPAEILQLQRSWAMWVPLCPHSNPRPTPFAQSSAAKDNKRPPRLALAPGGSKLTIRLLLLENRAPQQQPSLSASSPRDWWRQAISPFLFCQTPIPLLGHLAHCRAMSANCQRISGSSAWRALNSQSDAFNR
jgi:hypothetical protein